MKALMGIKNAWYTLVLLLFSIAAYAQEKKVDVDVDVGKESDGWYASPVVWVIGGAVFILLLVALLRGKKE
jgi:hypothetical protein